jgi:hypothetical protein
MVDRLLAYFEPWMTDDLAAYLTVIGEMFAQAELVYLWDEAALAAVGVDPEEMEEDVSYGQLLATARTTAIALPWLAQFVGERFPVGLGAAAQREWIRDRPNSRRGTLLSLANAAQRSLTGDRLVTIFERNDGTAVEAPDDVTIVVYADQCPDPAQVARDIVDTFPLELSLHLVISTGATWSQIKANYATWDALQLAKPTWADVVNDRSGGIVFPGSGGVVFSS